MKRIILNFEEKNTNFKALVQEAFNSDILNFQISLTTFSEFQQIERLNTYSKNLDLQVKNLIFESLEALENYLTEKSENSFNIGYYKQLKTKNDEIEILNLSQLGDLDFIIVSASDWKIIPFENLIAEMHKKDVELIASVQDYEEAELMLKTLEIGVDGILITPRTVDDIVKLKNLTKTDFKIEITKAKVLNIQNIPESERVCVDTTSLLHAGEGLLVGSTAKGFVLVHSEVFETQFVSSRPFRVNAGDVSAYVLVPGDSPDKYRTNYLSDLKGGDKIIAVKTNGEIRVVTIGRVKIETRPMLRFELEARQGNNTLKISCICQNAETVRLIDKDGNAISVVDIKVGDEVLVHIGPGATHFGTFIDETILEK